MIRIQRHRDHFDRMSLDCWVNFVMAISSTGTVEEFTQRRDKQLAEFNAKMVSLPFSTWLEFNEEKDLTWFIMRWS